MSSYIVTGATSFIGKYLISNLCRQSTHIYAIIRPSSPSRQYFLHMPNVTTVLADMGDTETWKQCIEKADYFFHLGWDGVGDEGRANWQIQSENVKNAIACIHAAAKMGCRAFLFAGSQAEYGIRYENISHPHPHPGGQICKDEAITEETPCNPVLNYAKGKLNVCQSALPLASQLGLTYYHTRIFSIYGKGDHPWALIPTCIKTLCAGREMRLSSCEQKWNYMAAADAADVIVRLMESGAPSGIYHIAGRDTRQLKSFIRDIYDICGGLGSLSFGTYNPSEPPASLNPSIGKLQAAIGPWTERPFRDEISAMVESYRTTGEL